jgi:hypothetical protein
MRKLPTRIQILGQEITVVAVPNLVASASVHGDWCNKTNTIRVQEPSDEHPKDVCFVSYYHELVHAILDLTGHEDHSADESYVERIAQALYQESKTRRYG